MAKEQEFPRVEIKTENGTSVVSVVFASANSDRTVAAFFVLLFIAASLITWVARASDGGDIFDIIFGLVFLGWWVFVSIVSSAAIVWSLVPKSPLEIRLSKEFLHYDSGLTPLSFFLTTSRRGSKGLARIWSGMFVARESWQIRRGETKLDDPSTHQITFNDGQFRMRSWIPAECTTQIRQILAKWIAG